MKHHQRLLLWGLGFEIVMMCLIATLPMTRPMAWGVMTGSAAQMWLGWWLLAPMPLGRKRAMLRRLAMAQSGKWALVIGLLTPLIRSTSSPEQALLGFVLGFVLVWLSVLWMGTQR